MSATSDSYETPEAPEPGCNDLGNVVHPSMSISESALSLVASQMLKSTRCYSSMCHLPYSTN